MPLYNDFYVRDALDDNGDFPYRGATLYLAPDIIPYGTEVVSDPDAFFSGNYASDVGKPILTRQDGRPAYNNIYVRTRNLGDASTNGAIFLYWSKSSLLLDVSQWSQQSIAPPTSSTRWPGGLPVSATTKDAITTGGSAFVWATPAPQGNYHYCLIAVVQTDRNSVAIPASFGSSLAFAQWISTQPAVCWRNVEIMPSLPQGQVEKYFRIASLDDEPRRFAILATCYNFPKNSTVRIWCPDTGPDPIIDQTVTIQGDIGYNTVTTTLPAKFDSHVIITATPPAGVPWPPNAHFSPSYHRYQMDDEDHPAFARLGVRPRLLGGTFPDDNALVRLGECAVAFSPAASSLVARRAVRPA